MTDVRGHSIIGTAGHIDHGKTALVKALTGVDVDTLAEEKRRGITIELGFAFMDSPGLDKETIFIDVPGHEKLIKTMVAGASNLDAALLVVAADEGISVQTVEHFEILQLFGIETGVVALTKSDLVDAEQVRKVTADVICMASGTFLEGAPIIPVSSVTGDGVDQLKAALIEAAKKIRKRTDSGIFRMPIDRVFTMQGFGAVIAGTILSGEVKIGDRLEILPEGLMAKVRGIQVHSKPLERSGIGTRTAINLQDVKKEQMYRGQCAAAPGSVELTTRLDARLQILKSFAEEMKNRTRVRFHVGTAEVMARAVLLDADTLGPGESGLVQFVLEEPTVALPKDRFVIRTFSTKHTMGGGIILDSKPEAHKRHDKSVLTALEKHQSGISDAVEQVFIKSSGSPLSAAEAAARTGENEADVTIAIRELETAGRLVKVSPEKYLYTKYYRELAGKLTDLIRDFYTRNPYRTYMPLADLQVRFLKMGDKQVYDAVLARLTKDESVRIRGSRIALSDRKTEWKPGEQEIAQKILDIYQNAGFSSPSEEEVMQQLGISSTNPKSEISNMQSPGSQAVDRRAFENIMTALIDQRKIVRLSEGVTYHIEPLKKARDVVVRHIKEHGEVTAAELRDKLGVSRRHAVAILEYMDTAQITHRVGGKRVLKQAGGGKTAK